MEGEQLQSGFGEHWLKEVELIRAFHLAEPPNTLSVLRSGTNVSIQLHGAPRTYEWQRATNMRIWA